MDETNKLDQAASAAAGDGNGSSESVAPGIHPVPKSVAPGIHPVPAAPTDDASQAATSK